MRLIFWTVCILVSNQIFGQTRLSTAIELFNEAKKAYLDSNYVDYLKVSLEAHALLPYSRAVKYNLAAAYAVNDRVDKSISTIEELIQVDSQFSFDADSVFGSLKSHAAYSDLLRKATHADEPIEKSQLGFELDDVSFHPESVAYSEKTGLFYISSMRKRKIVTYDPQSGEIEDWFTTKDAYDLYGVMGMKPSPDGLSLWFCSAPLPQIQGFREDGQYTPTVFRVSLVDKTEIDRFALPVGSVPGDLAIAPTGACYVSDSALPRIFRIAGKQARLFYDGDKTLVNLQGLALHGNFLFIADYLLGIHRLTISDKTLIPIEINAPNNTAGTDGLYYHDNSLIAIQNGVRPFRVTRYYLEDHKKVIKFEYYDKAASFLDEPTLGLLHNGQLYFVANSPWAYYEGNELLVEYLKKPQIRKVNLDLSPD